MKKLVKQPSHRFNSSQKTLRLKNCTPDGQEMTSNCVCDPLTSRPSKTTYPYSHTSGMAADISSGMQATGARPQQHVSDKYRWMCLNAWKFGFTRNVGGNNSERWHWELHLKQSPRPHVFTKIPRNHGSWDGQFNGNQNYFEDTYEKGILEEAARIKAQEEKNETAYNPNGPNFAP